MSRDMVYEDVPFVARREGDNLIAGQNNATILLGRDRNGRIDTGYGNKANGGGKGAGAIHLVVGRKEIDPVIKDDAATLYLSAKSDPDQQADTNGVGSQDRLGRSTAVLRADCIRMSSRLDLKVSVGKAYMTMTQDGAVVVEGDIQLGEGATERLLLGDTFAKVWLTHNHPTAVGTSGPPQPLPEFAFSSRSKCR